ncbi:MAG: hypothetical protein GY754_22480 [bacterium]|nr:hypothetical protein [bacterium]
MNNDIEDGILYAGGPQKNVQRKSSFRPHANSNLMLNIQLVVGSREIRRIAANRIILAKQYYK